MNAGTSATIPAPTPARHRMGQAASGAVPQVLLAQDNKVVATIIAKLLEGQNMCVRRVGQGAEALDALLAQDFALAVIDANLPAMSGVEVARHYRFAAIGRRRIPILGLIGAGKSSQFAACQIAACMDAGMDGCLPKPVDPAQLLEAVRSCLQPAPSTASAPMEDESAPAQDETPAEVPAINMHVLRDLEQLGGRAFVEDVVAQFVADAGRIFPELEQSIKEADVQSSRDLLHALRSCAANVGASAIFELCLAWRDIDLDELVARGEACLQRLETCFEEARQTMRDHGLVQIA
jgi:two-component system sensor histidine kinase RpfC